MNFYMVLPFVCARIEDAKGRILLGQHSDEERKPYPGLWDMPGGKLKEGETPEEAVAREVREETGFRVVGLILINIFHHSGKAIRASCTSKLPGIGICYRVKVSGNLKPAELKNLHWASTEELRTLELTPWCENFLRDLL